MPPLSMALNPVMLAPKLFERTKLFCAVPGSSAMTVTVLALAVAVTGTLALPVRAMAEARFVAAVVLE